MAFIKDPNSDIISKLPEFQDRKLRLKEDEIIEWKKLLATYAKEKKSKLDSPGEVLAWIFTKQGKHRIDNKKA